MNGKSELCRFSAPVQDLHLRRADRFPVDLREAGKLFRRIPDLAGDGDMIGLVHLVLWVQDTLHPLPVVRQKQETFRIEIQPPHGENAHTAVLHKLRNGGSSLFVGKRADIPPGLVEHQIPLSVVPAERHAVDKDRIQAQIRAVAQMRLPSVDAHTPLRDPLLG